VQNTVGEENFKTTYMKIRELIKLLITDKDFRQGVRKLTQKDVENLSVITDIEYAKQEAERLHAATGYKYYVIAWANGYKSVNMQWINKMKKAGLLPKSYDWLRLEKYSVYITQ